jgi:hypothetical protein
MVRTALWAFLTCNTTFNGHTRAVEYMLAWLMLSWGVVVLLPGGVLVGPTSKYFLEIASEVSWGLSAVVIGGVRLAALVINGAWKRTPLLRFAGAAIGLVWWAFLGSVYLVAIQRGAPPFPNMSIYPVFVFFEAYSCYRCGQDAAIQGSFTATRSPNLESGSHG